MKIQSTTHMYLGLLLAAAVLFHTAAPTSNPHQIEGGFGAQHPKPVKKRIEPPSDPSGKVSECTEELCETGRKKCHIDGLNEDKLGHTTPLETGACTMVKAKCLAGTKFCFEYKFFHERFLRKARNASDRFRDALNKDTATKQRLMEIKEKKAKKAAFVEELAKHGSPWDQEVVTKAKPRPMPQTFNPYISTYGDNEGIGHGYVAAYDGEK